jgi:hypothetical protein
MTETEEEAQRRANGEAMTQFMDRLVKAAGGESAEKSADATDEEESDWDDDLGEDLAEDEAEEADGWEAERPMTEAEAEEAQAESDRLTS